MNRSTTLLSPNDEQLREELNLIHECPEVAKRIFKVGECKGFKEGFKQGTITTIIGLGIGAGVMFIVSAIEVAKEKKRTNKTAKNKDKG